MAGILAEAGVPTPERAIHPGRLWMFEIENLQHKERSLGKLELKASPKGESLLQTSLRLSPQMAVWNWMESGTIAVVSPQK